MSFDDCTCGRKFAVALENHKDRVAEWLSYVQKGNGKPAIAGFVTCPAFPIPPTFQPSCEQPCQSVEASIDCHVRP